MKAKKNEQIRTDQTSNVENKEIDNNNIPLNKLYKRHHTTVTKY